jgi:hypothetical protein
VGGDAGDFVIDSSSTPFALVPGETHDVIVSFAPRGQGVKVTSLRMTSDDPAGGLLDVPLSGTGVAVPQPDIATTPSTHDYGPVVLGRSASQTFEIRNDGSASLDVISAILEGGIPASFSIDAGGAPFALGPGEVHDVTIAFTPAAPGSVGTVFRIASNDPGQPLLDVPLAGEGVEPGTIVLEETETGGSASDVVTTDAELTARAGDFYIAAVSSKPHLPSTEVAGLSLEWTLVISQCGARNQTGLDVWKGTGTPTGDGPVSATFPAEPSNAVIAVTRYSGVRTDDPIGAIVSGNTTGEFGSCSGGTDNRQYSLGLTTTVESAVVFAAAAMRDASHIPGAGWTEHVEHHSGGAGTAASVATMDQRLESATSLQVAGEFDGDVDYAVAAFELRPGSSAVASSEPGAGTRGRRLSLAPNRPNPFRTQTTLEYVLPTPTLVEIVIYDAAGRVVRRLVNGGRPAGAQLVRWNGRNDSGAQVGSGVYFLRLEAGPETCLRKLILRR